MFLNTVLALLAAALAATPALGATVPSSAFSVTIHPNGRCGKCLTAVAGEFNHNYVEIQDCGDFKDKNKFWYITTGNTYVWSAGMNQCLTGGSYGRYGFNPYNGIQSGLINPSAPAWPSASTAPSNVNWVYDGANKFQLAGYNFCLDLTDGNQNNGATLQIWDCVPGNTNQKWTVVRQPVPQ